jgi:L-iditol 2-dehydrogenase
MRAAVLHGPADLRVEDVPCPAPGPGEVRVKVEAALTGGTSIKMFRRGYHARMGRPPLRFGHEGAGVIDAVGEGVTRFAVGERVVPANSASCGLCRACAHGLTAQCSDMVWLTGFFAESLIVPARTVAGNLHRIPEGLRAEAAAMAEPLACVIKGHDRTPARRGERALVIGTGTLGLLWVKVLATAGAHVLAVGRRPERGTLALALGAERAALAHAFDPDAEEADLVVAAVGSTDAWELALAAASPGGRVNLFGGPPERTTVALDTQRLHYEELLVTASFHHTPFHFAEALRLLSEGFIDPARFIQERMQLEALPAYMARAAAGGGPLKAAVTPCA